MFQTKFNIYKSNYQFNLFFVCVKITLLILILILISKRKFLRLSNLYSIMWNIKKSGGMTFL